MTGTAETASARLVLFLTRRFGCTWNEARAMDAQVIRDLRLTGELV